MSIKKSKTLLGANTCTPVRMPLNLWESVYFHRVFPVRWNPATHLFSYLTRVFADVLN